MECVLSNRKHLDIVRFLRGSPALHDFSILVQDGQLRSRQLLPGNIRLRDFHFCHIIFHFDFLNFGNVLHGKLDALCSHIARSRKHFCHGIGLADHQFFYDMWFFAGYPFIHNFSIFICHRQLCPLNFLSICQRCFRKFKDCRFIFKDEFVRNRRFFRRFCCKDKLLHLICRSKSRSRRSLFHRIGKSNGQICLKGQLSILAGCLFLDHGSRFQDHIPVFIGNVLFCGKGKYSALQYPVSVLFFLQNRDFRLLTVILPVSRPGNFHRVLIHIGQVNLPDFPVQHIAFRCLLFFHIVFPKRKIRELRNPCLICGNRGDQLVLFVIVLTFAVRRLDVLQYVYLKGYVF